MITLTNSRAFYSIKPNEISGCVAYFPLDISGTTVVDSVSSRLGSVISGAEFTGGRLGSGVIFNGSTSQIDIFSCGSFIASNAGSFTISAWVYYNGSSLGPSGGRSIILGGRLSDNTCIGIGTNMSIECRTDDAAIGTNANAIGSLKWQHIVTTYQVNSGSPFYPVWNMYSNGSLVKVGSYLYATGNLTNQSTCFIGFESRSLLAFNGIIDEVAIYNRVLDKTDVSVLYLLGSIQKFNLSRDTDIVLNNPNSQNITIKEV